MAIFLPGAAEDQAHSLDEMTPREIVAELDKYVVGQAAAKRAVAVALRNRTRRQRLSPELAEEIMPKNILMIGSTGVGKTEIARRLAKLTKSPRAASAAVPRRPARRSDDRARNPRSPAAHHRGDLQ